MKSFRVDKSLIFLIVILIVLLLTAVFMLLEMRGDPISESLSGDNLLKVLFVVEEGGIPVSTNVIAYYPGSKRSAMFEIPGNTGLILRSLSRVDRLDVVFSERGIAEYRREIEGLLGISIPFSIVVSLDRFSRLCDFLGGFTVFIPLPVDTTVATGRILLPSGAVSLDGDKLRDYMLYQDELDQEGEEANRRQKAVLAFFRALSDNGSTIFTRNRFTALKSNLQTNLDRDSLRTLLVELSRIDTDRLVPQRVTGSIREVDGKNLLFPALDGQLVKDVVRQTLGGLASDNPAAQERIYAIEILNGTRTQGLARNTSELYQSFGYDVIRVSNAPTFDYDKTVIIDRIGNNDVAEIIGQVIRCTNIQTANLNQDIADLATDSIVDYTIILGRDFNGRFVR